MKVSVLPQSKAPQPSQKSPEKPLAVAKVQSARQHRNGKISPHHRVSKSVGAVVLNNTFQTLLVFQKKNTYWEFPKGKMEAGEREIDTLQREIYEETGIRKFRMVKDFRKVMYYDFRYKGQKIRRKVIYYLIKTGDAVKISEEHTDFVWLSLDKAKAQLKHKNQIILIDEVIRRVYG